MLRYLIFAAVSLSMLLLSPSFNGQQPQPEYKVYYASSDVTIVSGNIPSHLSPGLSVKYDTKFSLKGHDSLIKISYGNKLFSFYGEGDVSVSEIIGQSNKANSQKYKRAVEIIISQLGIETRKYFYANFFVHRGNDANDYDDSLTVFVSHAINDEIKNKASSKNVISVLREGTEDGWIYTVSNNSDKDYAFVYFTIDEKNNKIRENFLVEEGKYGDKSRQIQAFFAPKASTLPLYANEFTKDAVLTGVFVFYDIDKFNPIIENNKRNVIIDWDKVIGAVDFQGNTDIISIVGDDSSMNS